MIIRGICCLIPGVKGMSENIEVISIIDKFLEHPRLYIFENGGAQKMYISSADFMGRNLDNRVEISCPIYDEDIKECSVEDNLRYTAAFFEASGDKITIKRHHNTISGCQG